MRFPKTTAFTIGLMALAAICAAQTPRRIKVNIDNASIRSRPELDAEILDIAPKGTIFEVIEKAGAWYMIKMGEGKAGQAVHGYVHESMVEPSGEQLPPPPKQEKPRPAPQPRVVPPPPETGAPNFPSARQKLLSGSFLKYGFNDHWMASFGYDYGIGRYVGIGLEFQPYVENLSAAAKTIIQMDIFINLKAGFKVGFLTFYGGGGIGPDLLYTGPEEKGETSSQLKTRLAYHGIAGAALNIGKVALVIEYQPTWFKDRDVSPDARSRILFIGLRF